ncbi:MAG: efflux RND transporter periplasmic adaptor subunit [Patescibacteria group bacterium]|nr:efflux RND transporter periplasmic adaptor subunit [Patescibacteria group bacterium]
MPVPAILKKKSLYIILAIVLVGGFLLWQRQKAAGAITYETADVTQGQLLQTVEVTGDIKPAERIDLSFKSNGTLAKINAKVGESVKAGQVLAELEDTDLNFAYERAGAAVAVAQANLNAKLAGESQQSIRVAQAGVDEAKAAYDKAVSDLANTKIQVQNDLQNALVTLNTAQNNYDNAAPVSDQTLSNAIESAYIALRSALGPLNTALTDGDAVIGVDDTATNQMYKQYLGVTTQYGLSKAKMSYAPAKAAKLDAESVVSKLTVSSSRADISAASDKVQAAIEKVQTYLLDVKDVLANTIVSTYFTATELSTKKTLIDADYTGLSTQKTAVTTAGQALDSSVLANKSDVTKLADALKSAQVAYDIAKTNIDMKNAAAESAVAIQKAALQSAEATLDLKKAGPRAVDVAGLRASLLDAQVAAAKAESDLNNARIIAPVDGTISEILPDRGETVTANTAQIRMVGTSQFDIEAKVPEADIAKIEVGQKASITLDAYGDDVKFNGTVTAEYPDQTKVQDAIYYIIRVNVDTAGKDVKPGMTANVTVTTGEANDVLYIPIRAVKTVNDKKTVRVLVNNQPQTKEIALGLRGDEGKVQVISGLTAGEKVILSEKQGQ